MTTPKAIDLGLLQSELTAASLDPNVVCTGPYGHSLVWALDPDGQMIDLDAPRVAVVEAHVAPPRVIDHVATQSVAAVVRTTDDLPHEVFRTTTKSKHVYGATFQLTAVDAGNGTTKRARAEMTYKGLAASVVQVGTTVASTPMQDTAASAWQIQPSIAGADLIISVKGAAGRTVDWTLSGAIDVFAPEGLEA